MNNYESWKDNIRQRLEAFEGEGPPDAETLWHVAGHEAIGAANWIGDMPVSQGEIETAKQDILTALVALEMAEERLEEAGDE